VLPTSSPDVPGGFTFGSDNQLARASGLLGADDGTQLNEPEFTFNEDGELVEIPSARTVAGTPSAHGRSAMKSDADASAKVRRDHEERRMDGAHVSITAIYCCFYHYSLTRLSIDVE
jgi:meiotic recombination protein REC8